MHTQRRQGLTTACASLPDRVPVCQLIADLQKGGRIQISDCMRELDMHQQQSSFIHGSPTFLSQGELELHQQQGLCVHRRLTSRSRWEDRLSSTTNSMSKRERSESGRWMLRDRLSFLS